MHCTDLMDGKITEKGSLFIGSRKGNVQMVESLSHSLSYHTLKVFCQGKSFLSSAVVLDLLIQYNTNNTLFSHFLLRLY